MVLACNRIAVCSGLAALALAACKSSSEKAPASEPGQALSGAGSSAPLVIPATTGSATLSDTAIQANSVWSKATCVADAAAGQRVGKATIVANGDGFAQSGEVVALCGGYHQAATKRFAVGDGTLFRACLADGSVLQVSSDVQLTGRGSTEFRYENYKKTGPLIELFRKDVGVYNQPDEPELAKVGEQAPVLDIDQDWKTVELKISLKWPGYRKHDPPRLVAVTATWNCGEDMKKPQRN